MLHRETVAKVFKRDGSNKWQAECYWYDEAAGKRRRHCESTGITDDGTEASKLTAQVNADKIERGLAVRGPTKRSKTLTEALGAVAEEKEIAERSPYTRKSHVNHSVHLVEFLGENALMCDIDADVVRKYVVHAKQHRSNRSVIGELTTLGEAFRVSGLEHPPWPKIDSRSKPQRPLEVREQVALLAELPASRRLAVRVYLQLGLRFSELWKLSDLDFEAKYVHVNGTKTKRSVRDVPVPDDLLKRLQALGSKWQDALPAWDSASACKTLTRAARRAKLIGSEEFLSPNDLRGSYATHMARAGVQQALLARFMGTSTRMLDEVYAQLQLRGKHHHAAVRKGVPALPDCDNSATTKASKARTTSGRVIRKKKVAAKSLSVAAPT